MSSIDFFKTIEDLILKMVDEEGILAMDRLSGEETYQTIPKQFSHNLVMASKLREINPSVGMQIIEKDH